MDRGEVKRVKLSQPEQEETTNEKIENSRSFLTAIKNTLWPPLRGHTSFQRKCTELLGHDILENGLSHNRAVLRRYAVVTYSTLKGLACPLCELAVVDGYSLNVCVGDAYTADPAREAKREERMQMVVTPTRTASTECVAQLVPIYDHVRWNDMMIWVAKVLPLSNTYKQTCAKNVDGKKGYLIRTCLTRHVYFSELELLMERPEFKDIFIHVSKQDTIDITVALDY